MIYDVAILGAGISGATLAYTLSQYDLNILWLEKENDVAIGATRANSAIIHAGYDPEPGTLMAKLNVEGAALYPKLAETLDAYYEQVGSLVLAFDDADKRHLELLYERGIENGVKELKLLDRAETIEQEPCVNPDVVGSLYAPTAAIILPWEMCLAFAEVAVREGIELHLETKVTGFSGGGDEPWTIETNQGPFQARFVANCAGQGAEALHNFVAEPTFKLVPTRGEYYLLDAAFEPKVRRTLFQCPGPLGKGVLVTPTVHGNTLIGPNAEIIEDGEDTATTKLGLSEVAKRARHSVLNLRFSENIRSFAGVRANQLVDEFHLAWAAPQFYDVAAIKSPGLSAAPAIARYVIDALEEAGLLLTKKPSWNGSRTSIHFIDLTDEEKAKIIERDPSYGRVICRCQTITEGEILEAMRSPIPPRSIDGVKRRTGAGLGRCQGGFCGPRVHELLREHMGYKPEEVLLDGVGSYVVTGNNRPGNEA